MRSFIPYIFAISLSLMAVSCGVDGDPGHCYFSIDWEYYSEDYGVFYYEDNNPDVPDSGDIEAGRYYDSYPGRYDYYYESEDPEYLYDYTGFYELKQNPGTSGGLLHDGLDGADTYFELYLYVKARKGLDYNGGLKSLLKEQSADTSNSLSRSGRIIHGDPLHVETMEWSQTKGDWTLRIKETVRVYKR